MSWTRVTIEVDVDGDRDAAEPVLDPLLEDLFSNGRVIAMSAQWGACHRDDCDDYPCTCTPAREVRP